MLMDIKPGEHLKNVLRKTAKNGSFPLYPPPPPQLSGCRATIKSEVKLEKTLTFVLIATKTSWLFPQLKTEKKLNKLSRTM